MSSYILTGEADADVERIARTSVEQWGVARTERYASETHEAFQRTSEFPGIGRKVDRILQGYMRFGVGRHVIFYLEKKSAVIVVRVLHQQMLPENYLRRGTSFDPARDCLDEVCYSMTRSGQEAAVLNGLN